MGPPVQRQVRGGRGRGGPADAFLLRKHENQSQHSCRAVAVTLLLSEVRRDRSSRGLDNEL